MATLHGEPIKVGDKVWDINYGWATVTNVYDSSDGCSIATEYDTYTSTGRLIRTHITPSLFWDEIKFDIPKKPFPKLEVDTKVLVWDRDKSITHKRYFSHFTSDGKINVFTNGATSFSGTETITYDNWELYNGD